MKKFITFAGVSILATVAFASVSPKIDTSNDRVKMKLAVPYSQLGVLTPKDVSKVQKNFTIGCETLDRGYADYDAYKEYLAPLGVKTIRIQGGWAKTEKVKGVYDFAWLDKIISDARSRGLEVWLQLSYGNPIYKGAGTPYLKSPLPSSKEGKKAWDKWVEAMAKRYAGKVSWEVWNEPDLDKSVIAKDIADLNARTSSIILKVDPKAEIAGLSVAEINPKRFANYIDALKRTGKLENFKWLSYHAYRTRPEESYTWIGMIEQKLKEASKKVVLRMGEGGVPSKGGTDGREWTGPVTVTTVSTSSLSGHPWTEISQAKWILRRVLGDLARGYESNAGSIADMNYAPEDEIKTKSTKGLLATNDKNQVVKIKLAYYAVQNLASVFNLLDKRTGSQSISAEYPEQIETNGYIDNETGKAVFTIWQCDTIPTNVCFTTPVDVEIKGAGKLKNPVWIDILSGRVYEIPADKITRDGDVLKVKDFPIYDSPILVTEKGLVEYKK